MENVREYRIKSCIILNMNRFTVCQPFRCGFCLCDSHDCSDYFLLYQIADKRLYKAKEQGKNRIVAKGCTA